MFKELFIESKQIRNTISKKPNSTGAITRNITWKDGKFYIGAYDEAVLSVNKKGQVEAYSNKGSTKELAENVSNALKEKTPEMKELKKTLLKIDKKIICRSNYNDVYEVDIKTGKINKNLTEGKKITVNGTSPAGSWSAELSSSGEVTGGKDPWNKTTTTKWLKGLAYTGKEEDFMKAILKKDINKANDNSHVVITKIK
jgi:hypothetical protein